MRDGQRDGQMEAIAISPTLFFKKHGDNNLQYLHISQYSKAECNLPIYPMN